ncbi:MAG: hypothetical protein RL571_24 [Pseudomonadota bacterium]
MILTRGYDKKESQLGFALNKFRALGIRAFRFCYSSRQGEIDAIFGSNGHGVDGTHIDVSFLLHVRHVRLLPLSVFTPLFWQKRRVERYALPLCQVKEAFITEGFKIHLNPTESLQIHCDLVV